VGLLDGVHLGPRPASRHSILALLRRLASTPDATADELDLATGWLTLGKNLRRRLTTRWSSDAHYDNRPARKGVQTGALAEFMPVGVHRDSGSRSPALERGLADPLVPVPPAPHLPARRSPYLPPRAIEKMTDSWLWELANQMQNRNSGPGGLHRDAPRDLRLGTVHDESVPAYLAASSGCRRRSTAPAPIRTMEDSASDYAALLNDVSLLPEGNPVRR